MQFDVRQQNRRQVVVFRADNGNNVFVLDQVAGGAA